MPDIIKKTFLKAVLKPTARKHFDSALQNFSRNNQDELKKKDPLFKPHNAHQSLGMLIRWTIMHEIHQSFDYLKIKR